MPYDPFAPPPPPPGVTPPLDPNNALAPVMMPGGGTTGAPLQGGQGPFQGLQFDPHGRFDLPAFFDALQTWRAARPDGFSYDPNSTDPRRDQRQDWQSGMQDWRHGRPRPSGYPTTPVISPPPA